MLEESAYPAREEREGPLREREVLTEKEILAGKEPILLTFSAPWCPPCRALKPILDRIARELGKNLKVLVVDADRNPSLVGRFGVEGVPTSLLVVDGEVKDRIMGVQPFETFRKRLEKALA